MSLPGWPALRRRENFECGKPSALASTGVARSHNITHTSLNDDALTPNPLLLIAYHNVF